MSNRPNFKRPAQPLSNKYKQIGRNMAEAFKNYTRYPHKECVCCGSEKIYLDGHLILGTKHTGDIYRTQFYSLCHECRDVDQQGIALGILSRKTTRFNSFDAGRADAEQQTKDRMMKLAEDYVNTHDTCTLCGNSDIAYHNVFVIDGAEAHLYGGIPGRTRIAPYMLCKSCKDRPVSDIEDSIKQSINNSIEQAGDRVHVLSCVICSGAADSVHHHASGTVYVLCKHCAENDPEEDLCNRIDTKLATSPY